MDTFGIFDADTERDVLKAHGAETKEDADEIKTDLIAAVMSDADEGGTFAVSKSRKVGSE